MSSEFGDNKFGVISSEFLVLNSELRTEGKWMDWPLMAWLDEVLLQVHSGSPRKVLFWGDGVGGISSYVAGWIASKGIDVILVDGANRFDPYVTSSIARKALIPPERLLKRIRIARAFTCYQMATLMGEKLTDLFEQEGAAAQPQKPWVILLGPITTFLDEDVPEREVRPLFERSLRKVEGMAMSGIPFFLFQPNSPNPPFVKGGKGGLKDSKRSYLATRLFQFSNLVWRISLDDQGPKMILEKGINKIADCRIIS
jgi:hypothetical protein